MTEALVKFSVKQLLGVSGGCLGNSPFWTYLMPLLAWTVGLDLRWFIQACLYLSTSAKSNVFILFHSDYNVIFFRSCEDVIILCSFQINNSKNTIYDQKKALWVKFTV